VTTNRATTHTIAAIRRRIPVCAADKGFRAALTEAARTLRNTMTVQSTETWTALYREVLLTITFASLAASRGSHAAETVFVLALRTTVACLLDPAGRGFAAET